MAGNHILQSKIKKTLDFPFPLGLNHGGYTQIGQEFFGKRKG